MKALAIVLAALVLSGLLEKGESFGASTSNTAQTVSGGGVAAKVTYLKSNDDLRFQVVLDTHSVALDGYDLKAIIFLRDESGKTYLPNAVENKGSGHHRQATVIFPKIASGAKRVELVIKDVGGVKERIFRWDLE